jgi:hypothetical protein
VVQVIVQAIEQGLVLTVLSLLGMIVHLQEKTAVFVLHVI